MKRLVLLTALLSGCAAIELDQVAPGWQGLPPDADPKSFDCCWNPERHAEGLVNFSLSVAPVVVPLNPYNMLDEVPGTLTGKADAHAYVVSQLKPMDFVVLSNKTTFAGRIIPGRYTHAAIYFGTEAELRGAGLWDLPALDPLRDDIRAGKIFMEAFRPEVRMIAPGKLFETDAVAMIRPQLTRAQKTQAAQVFASKLGVPFDYWFDNSTPDELACTELLGLAMPSLDLVTRSPYGRPSNMPDDVVAQAIRGERMRLMGQVKGIEGGAWRVEGTREAMEDIAAFWGPKPGGTP